MDNNNILNEKAVETQNDDNFDIFIDISSNYYEAFITIESLGDEVSISRDDIISALKRKNVVFGLKNDVIDTIVNNPHDIYKLSVAEGEQHINGEPGRIEYNFDMENKKKPTMLSDGTVDHKHINYILKASKGEILAKKILPTESKDGKTVTGRTIKGKPGKLVDFKVGKNVTVSDDGILLLASEGGMIKVDDGRISIIKILEINDDVGISTGNINFEGKVLVKGNVNTGFSINSGDDVEIFGVVEGSEITARNIIIHKGVHNNAKLVSSGNISAHFMESCYAEAKGDIFCDSIIHCDITCLGRIVASEKKGLILGGSINVRKQVVAKTIGSQIGSTTRIYVGIDESLLIELKNTKSSIEDAKADMKKINQAIDILQSKRSQDPKKEIFLTKYLKTREQYITKIKNMEQRMKELYTLLDSLKSSNISSEQIYPGTNIRINNSHYIVKKSMINVKLMKEDGEIVTSPLV
ncbi:FapA family protein [Wukongibacter baidiensis]|uniref:DUF342 domain-containing protein n=1 Tax=Wukongibacter baidiensis TaxID=1723361 RepID=UPI003D7F642C